LETISVYRFIFFLPEWTKDKFSRRLRLAKKTKTEPWAPVIRSWKGDKVKVKSKHDVVEDPIIYTASITTTQHFPTKTSTSLKALNARVTTTSIDS